MSNSHYIFKDGYLYYHLKKRDDFIVLVFEKSRGTVQDIFEKCVIFKLDHESDLITFDHREAIKAGTKFSDVGYFLRSSNVNEIIRLLKENYLKPCN